MKQEIERKYAVKYVPEDLKIENSYHIEQCFVYHDGITLVRLRKITSSGLEPQYIYTVKTKGDISYQNDGMLGRKYEIESTISEKEYQKLILGKITNTIDKTRMVLPLLHNLKAEMDIYHGYLEGLITIEVEFASKEEAEAFEKPEWFAEEVGYKELSNRKLSQISREQFLTMISTDEIEKNRKIVQDLQNKKVINFNI